MDRPVEMIGTATVGDSKRPPLDVTSIARLAATAPHKLGLIQAPYSAGLIQTEKAFQAEVVRLAKREGWRIYHTHDSRKSAAGYPDLTLVHRVRGLVFAELKVPPNKPTADQLSWLDDLRTAGIRAFCWWPADWSQIEKTLRG